MDYSVTISQWKRPLRVGRGDSILAAALVAGVPYPHGCSSGNCGICRSRLLSGEVTLSPHSKFALTADERADGLILACRALPRSDCTVAWLELDQAAAHPRQSLDCRVVGIEAATHDIRIVRLEAPDGRRFDFSAGQYASVTFEGAPPRDYSMGNRPDQPVLEFHIRRVSDDGASAHVAEALSNGDPVRVEGPFGDCYLRRHHRGPIVAIAGGSGLAPIKSIIETALARGMRQPMHLYLGVHDERDIYLEDHIRGLARRHRNLAFTPVLSKPGGPTARRTGPVIEGLARDLPDLDGSMAYLAGPPAMVEAGSRALQALGMRPQDIHADAFYSEAEKAARVTC
ncbi:MAG: 2Fe-2S iron-sulfur cluster-binding protein [Kiloniellales bacterium]